MFNIFELKWDEEICAWFGIDPANMAQVCDSDSEFGKTDFEGVLPKKFQSTACWGILMVLCSDRDALSRA